MFDFFTSLNVGFFPDAAVGFTEDFSTCFCLQEFFHMIHLRLLGVISVALLDCWADKSSKKTQWPILLLCGEFLVENITFYCCSILRVTVSSLRANMWRPQQWVLGFYLFIVQPHVQIYYQWKLFYLYWVVLFILAPERSYTNVAHFIF